MAALTRAALGKDGKLHGIPIDYAIHRLAQSYGVLPEELRRPDRLDDLIRGLEFQSLEASVEVKRAE